MCCCIPLYDHTQFWHMECHVIFVYIYMKKALDSVLMYAVLCELCLASGTSWIPRNSHDIITDQHYSALSSLRYWSMDAASIRWSVSCSFLPSLMTLELCLKQCLTPKSVGPFHLFLVKNHDLRFGETPSLIETFLIWTIFLLSVCL